MTEIGHTPDNLSQTIVIVAQRQNRVAVCLRDRISVTATILAADRVGVENLTVGFGMMAFEPREQGRAKIETYLLVIVYRAFDFCCAPMICALSVGRVAFGMNALIPVVIGSRRQARARQFPSRDSRVVVDRSVRELLRTSSLNFPRWDQQKLAADFRG